MKINRFFLVGICCFLTVLPVGCSDAVQTTGSQPSLGVLSETGTNQSDTSSLREDSSLGPSGPIVSTNSFESAASAGETASLDSSDGQTAESLQPFLIQHQQQMVYFEMPDDPDTLTKEQFNEIFQFTMPIDYTVERYQCQDSGYNTLTYSAKMTVATSDVPLMVDAMLQNSYQEMELQVGKDLHPEYNVDWWDLDQDQLNRYFEKVFMLYESANGVTSGVLHTFIMNAGEDGMTTVYFLF